MQLVRNFRNYWNDKARSTLPSRFNTELVRELIDEVTLLYGTYLYPNPENYLTIDHTGYYAKFHNQTILVRYRDLHPFATFDDSHQKLIESKDQITHEIIASIIQEINFNESNGHVVCPYLMVLPSWRICPYTFKTQVHFRHSYAIIPANYDQIIVDQIEILP